MMKKYNQLILFAAVLTLLAYTGCGADMTKNAYTPTMEHAEAPAVAEGAPEAGHAGDAEIAVPAEGIAADMPADDAVLAEREAPHEDIAPVDNAIIEPEPVQDITPSVGMLTAGEWRDHDNWGFFSNLVNTGIISFPSFGIDPTQRIAVTVTDNNGSPLPNTEISLSNDTEIIWKSITDKEGKAYVFEYDGKTGSQIIAQQGEILQTIDIESAPVDEQGNEQNRAYSVMLDTEQKLYPATQIMFIVDTTGSMGDEMLFLQSDFSVIAEETGDENTSYSVNFYKDEGDTYVTSCSGFTSDVQAIKERLNAESASGGGDEPEAVYQILKETIFTDEWHDETVKIAFLIFDAPPHVDTEFQEIVAEASAKGIHLIPVVSSNGSRETELFGRALAICTNGSYVFLTDDSGIGDAHLEPIIGDYEVESLHDIIVRIISNYKQ